MFISDETIRTIQVVAKYRNITAAAEELNRVSSAVSYTVRQLEDTLGVKLFNRTGRQLTLTPAGEYFIYHSKAVLNDLEILKRNTVLATQEEEHELQVAINNIIPNKAITTFIRAVSAQFPSVLLNIHTEVYNGCWDALYSRKIDLVIGAPHAVPAVDHIKSGELGELNWIFVVGKNHPLAKEPEPLINSKLRKYAAICIKDTSINFIPQQAWLLEGQKPIFVPDYYIAMELINQNVGIGYLPKHLCLPLLTEGSLISKSLIEPKHSTKFFVAYWDEAPNNVRRWCADYLLQPPIRSLLCGDIN